MDLKTNAKEFYIELNDIFDELREENKRLNNELLFANKCLNVLNKFKIHLNNIYQKFDSIIDSKHKQELNELEIEFKNINNFEKIINLRKQQNIKIKKYNELNGKGIE